MIPYWMIADYLRMKANLSRFINDSLNVAGAPKSEVIKTKHPKDTWDYFKSKGEPYVGDPAWGVIDFYIHPERAQYIIDGGSLPIISRPFDCDDLSLWAMSATNGFEAELGVLVGEEINKSHSICIFKEQDHITWTIDTSGLHKHSSKDDEYIVKFFSEVFSTEYKVLYRHGDPFLPF